MATMEQDMHCDFEVRSMAASVPGAKLVFSTDAIAGQRAFRAEGARSMRRRDKHLLRPANPVTSF